MDKQMTPPTETFNPTPEQVEEVQKRIVEYWSHMYELPLGTFQDFAYWHLTELHRETETLRTELEKAKADHKFADGQAAHYARIADTLTAEVAELKKSLAEGVRLVGEFVEALKVKDAALDEFYSVYEDMPGCSLIAMGRERFVRHQAARPEKKKGKT